MFLAVANSELWRQLHDLKVIVQQSRWDSGNFFHAVPFKYGFGSRMPLKFDARQRTLACRTPILARVSHLYLVQTVQYTRTKEQEMVAFLLCGAYFMYLEARRLKHVLEYKRFKLEGAQPSSYF